LDVREQNLADLGSLQPRCERRRRGCGALQHVAHLRVDLRPEQVAGSAGRPDDNGTGDRQGAPLRQLAPGGQRLGEQPQQRGNDDRADDHENDIEQKPYQNRDESNKEDDGRSFEKFEPVHSRWRQSFSIQTAASDFTACARQHRGNGKAGAMFPDLLSLERTAPASGTAAAHRGLTLAEPLHCRERLTVQPWNFFSYPGLGLPSWSG